MDTYPVVLGIYSLRRKDEVGLGATAAVHDQVTYWYARHLDAATVEVQPLNTYHVPSGIRKSMPVDAFLKEHTPEPRYYAVHTVPALTTLKAKLAEGEAQFAKGKLDQAEKAFIKALMIDDQSVPANYGLGEVYSVTKDFAKLKKVLDTLLGLDEAFNIEHRQRLNSFGISLRKNGHFDASINFFSKALELHAEDENIHFNLARVHYDRGEIEACVGCLKQAVRLNPGFTEAVKFIRHCEKARIDNAQGR